MALSKTTIKLEKKFARQEMLAQGGYDGRFGTKTVKDKKKEASKRWAKDKSIWN